jgi:hypothetical protein
MSHTVLAELGFLAPSDKKPVYFASQAGADAELNIAAKITPHSVTILDARAMTPAPTLDKEGFALAAHASSVSDFYDDEQIRNIYEDEVVTLVRAVTGASKVVVFDNEGLATHANRLPLFTTTTPMTRRENVFATFCRRPRQINDCKAVSQSLMSGARSPAPC